MASSHQLTYQEVIDYLKKHAAPRVVTETEIGYGKSKQKIILLNNEIQPVSSVAQIRHPQSDDEILITIHKKLGLVDVAANTINAQGLKEPFGNALLEAITDNHAHLVKVLIDHGADPSKMDQDKENAFIKAAKLGHSEILKELLTLIKLENGPKAIVVEKTQESGAKSEPQTTGKKENLTEQSSEPVSKTSPTAQPSEPVSKTSSTDKNALRVSLDVKVLQEENRWGETAEALISKFIKKHAQEEKIHAAEMAAEKKYDALEEKKPGNSEKPAKEVSLHTFNALVEKAHLINKTLAQRRANETEEDKKKVGSAPTLVKTPIQIEAEFITSTEKENQEKRQHVSHLYDGFINNKLHFFARKQHGIKLETVQQITARNHVRHKRGEYCSLIVSSTADLVDGQLPLNAAFVRVHGNNNDELHYFNKMEGRRERIEMKPKALEQFDSKMHLEQAKKAVREHLESFQDPKVIHEKHLLTFKEHAEIEQITGFSRYNPAAAEYQFTLEKRGNEVLLPSFGSDQYKVKAALSLIKDYYAPEGAPLPHFLEAAKLRRILTFHWGRRYTRDAENLFKAQQALPLKHAQDIMTVYNNLHTEFLRVIKFNHDGNNNNSPYNSSYTRRLFNALELLRKTEAYITLTEGNDAESYLGHMDLMQLRA